MKPNHRTGLHLGGEVGAERQQSGLDWQYVVSREDLEQFAAKYEIPLVEEMPESSNQ